jgi:hypothetical protein
MISTAIFIMVCASAACYAALLWWLWRGYRRACALRVCHHCGHQLTKFAGGRMPWCPECGGLSGPRTRWRFVRKELRRPRVIGVAVIMVMGFVFAGATGPGVSWAARAGMLGTGTTLWLAEHVAGDAWRSELIDRLCVQDGMAALGGVERKRLASLILADAQKRGLASLDPKRDLVLMRFAAAGVLDARQVGEYDAILEGQIARLPKRPVLAPPPLTGTQIVYEVCGPDWKPDDAAALGTLRYELFKQGQRGSKPSMLDSPGDENGMSW